MTMARTFTVIFIIPALSVAGDCEGACGSSGVQIKTQSQSLLQTRSHTELKKFRHQENDYEDQSCLKSFAGEFAPDGDHARGDECVVAAKCLVECGQQVDVDARLCLGDEGLHLQKGTALVEVGTNVGADLSGFLERYPAGTVYSYEPNKELWNSVTKLPAVIKAGSQAVLIHKGVSNETGVVKLHVPAHHSEAASAFKPADAADVSTNGETTLAFETVRLRDALQHVEQDQLTPIALSVNCEGCEYAVMEDFVNSPYLGKLSHISLSWHSLAQIERRHERRCAIEASLLRACYERTYFSYFGWQGWRLLTGCTPNLH